MDENERMIDDANRITAQLAQIAAHMKVETNDPNKMMQALFDNLGKLQKQYEARDDSFKAGIHMGLMMAQVLAAFQFEGRIDLPVDE